ncbi:hypothetical protein MNBD_BACTEROID03-1524 [hydrothermal vent metagenome]|uniref:Uncharacterized protein n=1 Tax=hydrothermal vent metagenome TaxID=652676 RepID=A0A3B0TU81_9ZZZZ
MTASAENILKRIGVGVLKMFIISLTNSTFCQRKVQLLVIGLIVD